MKAGRSGAAARRRGAGTEFVDGNPGNDTAFLGAGDDSFQWDPGDGSDVVEGQAGSDTLRFNGSAASETMAAAAGTASPTPSCSMRPTATT